jgi:polyphenol oxidase
MKSVKDTIKLKALHKNQWIIETQGDLLLVFSPLLKKYPNFVHAFTTRQGGQSKPPFNSFNIGINNTTDEGVRQDARNNRELLCRTLNIPCAQLRTAKQLVHSTKVVMLEKVGQADEVDGIVTKEVASPIYMTFADCVPVIIYDPVKHIFCLVHAGWRGTAGGISKEAVRFMTDECGSDIKNLVCAIGPAIGSCCYPVGIEAVEKLIYSLIDKIQLKDSLEKIESWKAVYSLENWSALNQEQLTDITNKFWVLIESLDLEGLFIRGSKQIHVDLKAINASQIMSAGIEQVDVTNLCTACKEDLFYSYRRSFINNQGPTGRQAAIACLL